MKILSIQIFTSILISYTWTKEKSVDRSDGTQGKGDRFHGFGSCDGTTSHTTNNGCKCNGATTFYIDGKNRKPLCYNADTMKGKTDCELRHFNGRGIVTISFGSKILKLNAIEVWDTMDERRFWNIKWMNELKEFVSFTGNAVMIEKKDANLEGLLIRITVELPLTPNQPITQCVIVKVKGRKTYPLTRESILPNGKRTPPPTTTTTTRESIFTNGKRLTTTTTPITVKTTTTTSPHKPVKSAKMLPTTTGASTSIKTNATADPLKSKASTSTPLIVGIILATLVLFVIVFIFFFIRRKRHKKERNKTMELQNNQPIYAEYDASVRETDAQPEDGDSPDEYAYTYNSTKDIVKISPSEQNDYGYAYNNPQDLQVQPEKPFPEENNYYSPVISEEKQITEIPEYAVVNKERK